MKINKKRAEKLSNKQEKGGKWLRCLSQVWHESVCLFFCFCLHATHTARYSCHSTRNKCEIIIHFV